MTISSNSRKKSRGAALLFKAAILVLIMTAVFTFTSCGEQQAAKKEPQALENKEQTLDAADDKAEEGAEEEETEAGSEAKAAEEEQTGPQKQSSSTGSGGSSPAAEPAAPEQNTKPAGSEAVETPVEPAKPSIQITGHVSYATPLDCPYTQDYLDLHGGGSYVFEDGSVALVIDNEVVGINVVSEEVNAVRYDGKTDYVWGSETRDYLDKLRAEGIIVDSWGNNCVLPGNDYPSNEIRSYDAIVPISLDDYLEYYVYG